MRILFSFAGGAGHFEPLVPIARAAAASGHEIRFVARPPMVATVAAAGFTAVATGEPDLGPPPRIPLQPIDLEREDWVLRDGFAGWRARQRAADLVALCEAQRPDVLVCDEIDFGAVVAAERLGLPHATVLVIAAGSFVRRDLVREPLNRLRAEHDLPADPDLAMLERDLVLCPFPPSFRDPAFPLPPGACSIRLAASAGEGAAPAWLARNAGAPLVYFTLGTVFNVECGDLFARVLAGLRELPIEVVATVGREIDPAELGPQPAHVHVERFIPQGSILPRCSAVVSHGGSGSILGALAHGLPSVLLPMGADQPFNARRGAALGVSRTLDAVAVSAAEVRAAVSDVLGDPRYRQRAERLRDELAALPGPEHAVALLERLVR